MNKINITQIKSSIGKQDSQKKTLQALGLRKIGESVEHQAIDSILGMVAKVSHLVSVSKK